MKHIIPNPRPHKDVKSYLDHKSEGPRGRRLGDVGHPVEVDDAVHDAAVLGAGVAVVEQRGAAQHEPVASGGRARRQLAQQPALAHVQQPLGGQLHAGGGPAHAAVGVPADLRSVNTNIVIMSSEAGNVHLLILRKEGFLCLIRETRFLH